MPREADRPSPLRILLVSDDDEFVAHVLDSAFDRGVEVARAGSGDDLEIAAFRHGANVVVVDADAAPRRSSRAATAFASEHPGVTVVLAATAGTEAAAVGEVALVEREPAESLLRDVDRIRCGYDR